MNHMDEAPLLRDNGEGVNPVELERSRRLHLKRLGVIICFVLIFMDGGPQQNVRPHREDSLSDQSSRAQSAYTSKLNAVINSKKNLNFPMSFARNITGVFHGKWELNNATSDKGPAARAKTFMVQLRSVKLNNVPDLDFVYGVAKLYKAGTGESDLFFPLQGVFLATTGTLHLLSSVSASEMLFLQLPDSADAKGGVVTPSGGQGPGGNASGSSKINKNSVDNRAFNDKGLANNRTRKAESESPKSRKRRRPRLLTPEPASPWVSSSMGVASTDWDSYREASALSRQWQSADEVGSGWLDGFNSLLSRGGRGGSEGLNSLLSGGYEGSYGPGHRILELDKATDAAQSIARPGIDSDAVTSKPTPAKMVPEPLHVMGLPRALEVGSTGMSIYLLDTKQPPFVITNTSSTFPTVQFLNSMPNMNPNFIQAIGEASLPANFKNLQRAATGAFDPAFGLGFGLGRTGSAAVSGGIAPMCQFSVHLSEVPMDAPSSKYRDQKKMFLNQLMPNVSGSEAGIKGFAEEEAAAAAKKKAAYASSIFGHFDSSACGVSFNVTAASLRLEFEVVEKKASNFSFAASGICFIQIALLVLQLRYSRTQAASTKISILCISAQSMLDAALCIGHLVLCAALPQVFFSHFMWVAILKLLLFGVFEMRTVITIYQARYAQEIAGEAGLDGLRQRLAKVHLRFYAALFASVFIALYCRSVPMIAVFIFYSYWIPQIVWNITSGTRRTFHPLYCIGTTASRLFIPLYLLGCPMNFFSVLLPGAIPFSPATCVGLVLWTTLQMTVLLCQDFLGPRFCLPASMFPRAYDYYRPVPAHVLRGSHSPSPESSEVAPADVESGVRIECVICYNVVETDNGTYMITPCDHLFHKHCLEQWLTMKMECCICRAVLPPLEDS